MHNEKTHTKVKFNQPTKIKPPSPRVQLCPGVESDQDNIGVVKFVFNQTPTRHSPVAGDREEVQVVVQIVLLPVYLHRLIKIKLREDS